MVRPVTVQAHQRGRLTRVLALLLPSLALSACAELAPLRHPPELVSDDPVGGVTTRDEALARLGRPDEVRASDVGEVLVYRRVSVVDANPNRYYGEDRGARFDRYERLLLFIDPAGRVARWSVERE